MLRISLFAILFFFLPHVDKLPWMMGILPNQFPLGLLNIIIFVGCVTWLLGKMEGEISSNPFRAYSVFVIVVVIGVPIALVTGFEKESLEVLRVGKEEITLLLLYFVPLAITKNKEDFAKIFLVVLLVHAVIGLECLRSGVLVGETFSDAKRGSGPFGYWYRGSDIAGAYLAQVIMFFIAIIVMKGTKVIYKGAAFVGAVLIFWGLLATYSRGALIGFFAGLFAMLFIQGSIKARNVLMALMIGVVCFMLIPKSTVDRFSKTVDEEGELDVSTKGRFTYYEAALAIAKDYPIGVGTGQVRNAMSRYLPMIQDKEGEGQIVDPHNGFLFALCENGIVGLAVFLWLLWKLFFAAREAYMLESLPMGYRVYALGMVGFMGALIVCNVVYANFFKIRVMGTFVIHMGMLAYVKGKMVEAFSNEPVDVSLRETAVSGS